MKKRIGIELRSLNNQIMRYLENHSHKKSLDSITGTNGWIIGHIRAHSDGDVFQRDLEEEFGITRSTASKVVGLMVQKGLVKKESVAGDARLKKLVLTEKALEVSEIMGRDGDQMESILCTGFSPEELEQLYSYIERMRNNLR